MLLSSMDKNYLVGFNRHAPHGFRATCVDTRMWTLLTDILRMRVVQGNAAQKILHETISRVGICWIIEHLNIFMGSCASYYTSRHYTNIGRYRRILAVKEPALRTVEIVLQQARNS